MMLKTIFLHFVIYLFISKINFFSDLWDSDVNCDNFMKKLQRANEALSYEKSLDSDKSLNNKKKDKWLVKNGLTIPVFNLPKKDAKTGLNFFNIFNDFLLFFIIFTLIKLFCIK